MTSWQNRRRFPQFGDHYDIGTTWIDSIHVEDALNDDGTLHSKRDSIEGNLRVTTDEWVKEVVGTGLKLIRAVRGKAAESGKFMFANDLCVLTSSVHGIDSWGESSFSTADEATHIKMSALIKANFLQDDASTGPVSTLAKTTDGYKMIRIGTAGVPLERGNYTTDVVTDYDHIVKDLQTCSPCGRLSVLQGSPGTGKTYLVRALTREVKNGKFVIIPPSLVAHLGNPDILPTLAEEKADRSGPMVLLVEDGDMCLVQREGDNMNTVQSILNMGDGILGSILDIRMIITTNAEKFKMDQAALRAGRLCRIVNVGTMPIEQGAGILERLIPGSDPSGLVGRTVKNGQQISLAEVYGKARSLGWEPPAPPKKKISKYEDSFDD